MAGDIKCPRCGAATSMKTAKKGNNAGKSFYVCSRYPECKGKIAFDEYWERKIDTERQGEFNQDAVIMCNSIRTGKLSECMEWLEQRPNDEIIDKFLGIIYSKWAFLPIVCAEETPPVLIDGVKFDSIKNISARIMTKITLLLVIGDESKKLGIWDQIQIPWTEKYVSAIKEQVRVSETIVKGWENSGHDSEAADLRQHIKAWKESNKEFVTDW